MLFPLGLAGPGGDYGAETILLPGTTSLISTTISSFVATRSNLCLLFSGGDFAEAERIHLAPSSSSPLASNAFSRPTSAEIPLGSISPEHGDDVRHSRSKSFFVAGVSRQPRRSASSASASRSSFTARRGQQHQHSWSQHHRSGSQSVAASRTASINTPRRREVQLSKISIYIIIMFVICHR